MKFILHNTSVRTKLTGIIMLVSVFILLSLSSLFVTAEIFSYRTSLEEETATLAGSLAANCKDLLLTNRHKESTQVLASLQLKPNIRAAYLFDEHGNPVAEYLDQSDSQFLFKFIQRDFSADQRAAWQLGSGTRLTTSWDHLSLFMPIMHEQRQVGVIYLLSDLQDLYGQLSGVVSGTLLLLGIMLACSWYLAGLLQRPISVPLLRLVETMQSISRQQNYSLRAEKFEQDEIGVLVDGFNRTLDQIEFHRGELVKNQNSLEQTVALRTSELRRMVIALETAKGQAEAASEAKSQFLANITHELRTPLIGVLGMNELLFKTRLDGQQKMLAETVHKSGEDLLLLINDVLDFSKIEAGELKLEEHEFVLHQVVEEVVALLAGQAADKGVALYVDIDIAAAWKVRGDQVRIRQILMNLVGNAIKFTEQGAVTVKLFCVQEKADKAEFAFEISDTGVGMDATEQQRLFSAFYQADNSHTRGHGGTGLGLAIVRQLVELLQGEIAVESQPGVGSRFKVSFALPLVERFNLALPENLHQQRLLLHLGDPLAQQLLHGQLRALGFNVMAADCAADVLYQLGFALRTGQAFGLVLIAADLRLPDGKMLYAALREDPAQRALRRIVLLGRNDTLVLQKQEQLLYQPTGWTDLHATLCRCWHELHLVQPAANLKMRLQDGAEEVVLPKILLAGGGVASRELTKLALTGLPLQVDVAGNLEQLVVKVSQHSYLAVLLDLKSLPIASLLDLWQDRTDLPPTYVMYAASDSVVALESIAAGLLEKPVSRASLATVLQPVLDKAGTLITPADGGRA